MPSSPLPGLQVETLHGRRCVSTGSRWEPVVGYSRAVRAGDRIAVTGTIGLNLDGTVPETIGAQARRALEIVLEAVAALGGRPEHIFRTRIYVTDISKWEEVGRAHRDALGHVRPATTMVEVTGLAMDGALVEIEADALVEDGAADGS